MRILSLNLQSYPNHNRIGELAALVASYDPDVALFQECRRSWFETLMERTGLVGVHSHDLEPVLRQSPPDGCAIGVKAPLGITRSWRLPPETFQPAVVSQGVAEPVPAGFETLPDRLGCGFSARTIFAEVTSDAGTFVAVSLHATPGRSHIGGREVSEWKPFFHGAVAVALQGLPQPFVFGIDANEPLSATMDGVSFHWADGRPGAAKFAALLGLTPLHRARDLLRQHLHDGGGSPESDSYLALTYTTRGGGLRCFDHLWATPEFRLVAGPEVHYREACAAGTDHALLVADVELALGFSTTTGYPNPTAVTVTA